MGAVTTPIQKLLGRKNDLGKPTTSSEGTSGRAFPVLQEAMSQAQAANAPSAPATPPTARQQEQVEQAARRRSRRRGRALLSEARLSPEEGVGQSTLGTGSM